MNRNRRNKFTFKRIKERIIVAALDLNAYYNNISMVANLTETWCYNCNKYLHGKILLRDLFCWI